MGRRSIDNHPGCLVITHKLQMRAAEQIHHAIELVGQNVIGFAKQRR
jgi:hypothetical protein